MHCISRLSTCRSAFAEPTKPRLARRLKLSAGPIATLTFCFVVSNFGSVACAVLAQQDHNPSQFRQQQPVQMSFTDMAATPAPALRIRPTDAVPTQESDFPNSDFTQRLETQPIQQPQTPQPEANLKLEGPVDFASPPEPDPSTDKGNGGPTDSSTNPNPLTQKRSTDDPVSSRTFELEDPAEPSDDQEPSSPQSAEKQDYQLPNVADVHAAISLTPLTNVDQHDPSGLLRSESDVQPNQPYVDQYTTYSNVSGVPSSTKLKLWQAHDFYHQPLYFEERNLERHGHKLRLQNLASAAHFIGTIPTLPYRIGHRLPQDRVYTHGQYRPGDAAPYEIQHYPHSRRGAALQTLVTLGLILP